jgi:hypothetical protein
LPGCAGFAKSQPTQETSQATSSLHIKLGQAVAPLYGPWKFRVGDSPVNPATGAPLWAEPGFDDSAWETIDFAAGNGASDPINGQQGYLSGWTGRGHANYWGFAWYRLVVHVEARPNEKLALAGPSDVDDCYQVFDNGRLLGSFGDFSSGWPKFYFSQPMLFQLPQSGFEHATESTRVLAFRVWMHPETLLTADDAGGIHNAPLLGEADAVAAQDQMRWDGLRRAYAGLLIEAIVFTLLCTVAFSLALFDPSDAVYLWIGMLLLSIAIDRSFGVSGAWTQWIPATFSLVEQQVFFESMVTAGWVVIWRVWFRLRSQTWILGILPLLVVLLMLSNFLHQRWFVTFVPLTVSQAFGYIALAIRGVVVFLLLFTVFQGIRQRGLEGWIALPAVLLAAFSEFYAELRFLHILEYWFPFGIQITMRQLANFLLVAVLAVLLLRRLRHSMREQRRLALDVKQAQEVQRVILPEAITTLPGLTIDNEYRPAREVGGDFYQIIPHHSDGSLLIVAGDVAGKGLQAGMLVALLVGAIRMAEEVDSDPLFVLQALNRRLLGRADAQATCLALRIERDGSVLLANAGHIPPYLNGEPVAIEGALPLGIIERAEFSLLHFQLMDGDTLLMMSDGIPEAMNAEGHLFGFERVHELLRIAVSAAELANAAQRFGQEDDISVISVTRAPIPEMAHSGRLEGTSPEGTQSL